MKKFLLVVMLLFATNMGLVQAQKPVILKFDEGCISCSITLLDEKENIVYTTTIDETVTVELPENLIGIFELQLFW